MASTIKATYPLTLEEGLRSCFDAILILEVIDFITRIGLVIFDLITPPAQDFFLF